MSYGCIHPHPRFTVYSDSVEWMCPRCDDVGSLYRCEGTTLRGTRCRRPVRDGDHDGPYLCSLHTERSVARRAARRSPR